MTGNCDRYCGWEPAHPQQPIKGRGRAFISCIRELSSAEKRSERDPWQTIQDGVLIQSRTARLIDAVADRPELTDAMGIGRHGNHDARFVREACILRRKVEAIGAGIDLEKAAVPFRVIDNTLDVELIARTLEKKAAGRVPEDVEIAVIHGAQYSLGLLFPSKGETGMYRAHGIIAVSYTHLRAHETGRNLVCRLLLEKKKHK